jgi:5,10-methylenetetrahydrofolate reductase
MIKQLRDENKFQCGEDIKGVNPRFFIGGASNPFADPFEFRPYRLAKKAKAGVDFIQTQLIYNVPKFKEFMKRVVDLGAHEQVYILAGVGPLKTAGAAKYMRDQVPGLDMPNEYVERMEAAAKGIEDKKEKAAAQREEGIKICVELIQQMREIPGVAGVHIMAIEWEEAVAQITEKAGLLPRPVVA